MAVEVGAAASNVCDAGIPIDGKSRLDLIPSEFATELRGLAVDGELPPLWENDDLRDVIPDLRLRKRLARELEPMPIAVYEAPISVPETGNVGTHAFLKFTDFYDRSYERAKALGRCRRELDGTHFHAINEPDEVVDTLLELADATLRQRELPET